MGLNKPVDFPTAKLLKEKGFNEEVRDYYEEKFGTFYHSQYFRDNISINEKHKGFVVAPTIADVVMWLYEKHGIWISVKHDYNEGVLLGLESVIDTDDGFIDCGTFKNPNQAYEAAILYCLTNLI